MEQQITLPTLQSMLDRLANGERLSLARKQVEVLFGFNDVAATRLLRFASGHDCIVAHADSSVVFEKRSRC